MNDCNNNSSYRCQSVRCSYVLCERCFDKKRRKLLGPTGRGACTDIYDARVVSIDWEGRLYLAGVRSRAPPTESPNWRTTYRLKTTSLVAVIGVDEEDQALDRHMQLSWGEVANHARKRDHAGPREHEERQRGKLCVAPVSIGNSSGVATFGDSICTIGSRVVILDCRVFVPEKIPVLSVLRSFLLGQETLPFDDARLLGVGATISHGDENEALQECLEILNEGELVREDHNQAVRRVLEVSSLRPIADIRDHGHPNDLATLTQKLSKLLREVTLDGGQLQAFLRCLIQPVSVVQGPPGTGKSYLGVALTRAYLMLRNLWQKVMPSVGAPPILVMSYKNHAINEILEDILKAIPKSEKRALNLVRLGGGGSDYLANYSERAAVTVEIKTCQEHLQKMFHAHQRCLDYMRIMNELRTHLSLILLEDDEQEGGSDQVDKIIEESLQEIKKNGETFVKMIACVAAFDSFQRVHNCLANSNPQSNNGTEVELRAGETEVIPLDTPPADLQTTEDRERSDDFYDSVLQSMGNNKTRLSFKAKFPTLHKGIQHWKPDMEAKEALLEWIAGTVPPPACQAEQCLNLCSRGSAYCRVHRCIAVTQSGTEILCENFCEEGLSFCERHACLKDDCFNQRIRDDENFCVAHACFVCVQQGVFPAGEATDSVPRNVCTQHPLCVAVFSGDGSGCVHLSQQGNLYCINHASLQCKAILQGEHCTKMTSSRSEQYCSTHARIESKADTCAALTKKKKPCQGQPWNRSLYCIDHQRVAPQESKANVTIEAAAESALEQCWAKSKKKKRCQSSAIPTSPFCRDHQGRTAPSEWKSSSSSEAQVGLSPLAKEVNRAPSSSANFNDPENHAPIEEPSSTGTGLGLGKEAANEILNEKEGDNERVGASSCVVGVSSGEEEINAEEEEEEEEYYDNSRLEIYVEEEEDEFLVEQRDENTYGIEQGDGDTEDILPVVIEEDPLPAEKWSWGDSSNLKFISLREVLSRFGQLLRLIIQSVGDRTDMLRRSYRRERNNAKVKTLQQCDVIGGTIVGCIARIDAIRTVKPFAVIVEEASEVAETLLLPALVNSARKLDMIGDDRQLQASTDGKMAFEIRNKVGNAMSTIKSRSTQFPDQSKQTRYRHMSPCSSA